MSCFRRLWVIVMVWLGMAAVGWGLIDQSQPNYTYTADCSGYGTSGQTFYSGMNGQLIGIRLIIEGCGQTDAVYGSDFRIDLHKVNSDNVVNPKVLASGTMSRDGILFEQPKWFEIFFDVPYQQTKGERLAFTIQEYSGGGAKGWNEFGMKSGNPYGQGQYFFHYTSSSLAVSSSDMAFETIVIPEPATLMLLAAGLLGWRYRK